MAHESFEDKEIAELLNREFIAVKVDREERPDVDAVYMSVCQAMTGQGGWPLTILMTPEQKPFYAATYLPPRSRYGMTGLDKVLKAAAQGWKTERKKLLSAGDQIQEFLQSQAEQLEPGEPDRKMLEEAFEQYARTFDSKYGGFGQAPKFPAPHNLMFLMRYAAASDMGSRETKPEANNRQKALQMVEATLVSMYRGGIFDHVGGGFSRYSTDRQWLVPHFEKMLYDNALLAMAYLEAFSMTQKELYLDVAKRTLNYVLRELTDAKGGFYCGQDADSDGEEGKYYTFTPGELKEYLGDYDAEYFCKWYGITEKGNFEGKSIPNLLFQTVFKRQGEQIKAIREKLWKIRLGRTRLHKDDKILTSWNGLMAAAFAKAYLVTGEAEYLNTACRAVQFTERYLVKNGRLLVRYRDGESGGEGTLDDYAFYCIALLGLYDASFETEYLEKAAYYGKMMLDRFNDPKNGGFYINASDVRQLIVRCKETYDGAMPSGNSAAAWVLWRLARLTDESLWQEAFDRQMCFMSGSAKDYPAGHGFFLLNLLELFSSPKELVCLNPRKEDAALLRRMQQRDPSLAVLVKTQKNQAKLEMLAPFTANYKLPGEGALFYLCSGRQCRKPVRNLLDLETN